MLGGDGVFLDHLAAAWGVAMVSYGKEEMIEPMGQLRSDWQGLPSRRGSTVARAAAGLIID